MTSLRMEQALRVCNTCKMRKKGCDKQLPSCGYCTKRGLVCRYDDSPANSSGHVAEDSGSAWLWCIPARVEDQHATGNASPNSHAFPMQMSLLSDPSPASRRMTLDSMLNQQVCHIFQCTSLSLQEISERFFRDFHRWLPVISPRLFHETATKAHPPQADFSVLLLAMCLITLRRPAGTSEHLVYPEALYVTVRMLFGHVQAVICASTTLVQAGLLISAYEYTCGRPDAAYISMGTCARMAYTLGMDRDHKARDELQHDTKARLRALEEWNVWWGVVVLERLILVEIANRNQRPVTEYPSQDSHLPSDLGPAQQSGLFDAEPLDTPMLSAVHASNVSSFGRQVQAVHLLDQVLRVISLPAGVEARLPELRRLDEKLRAFLTVIMGECGLGWGLHCGAMATAIRSFFILHEDILTRPTSVEMEAVGVQWGQSSRAALHTATKIMVDGAHDHMKHIMLNNVDALPLCCSYNFRVAMKHIEDRGMHTGGEECSRDLQPLLALDKAFCKRWGTAGA